ncbi:MAG: DUF7901 domain-containing protein [Planctomycetota bacterium]|jgi:hypothetical protein
MADDWQCKDDRPVTDIHWWGSFLGWGEPYPPPILPSAFHIGIWTNTRAGVDASFSHPDHLIWENFCDNWVWNFYGYDEDPRQADPDFKETCFQFNQLLSEDEWFYQEPNEPNTIYWLSIAAIYDPNVYTDPNFYPILSPAIHGRRHRRRFAQSICWVIPFGGLTRTTHGTCASS